MSTEFNVILAGRDHCRQIMCRNSPSINLDMTSVGNMPPNGPFPCVDKDPI